MNAKRPSRTTISANVAASVAFAAILAGLLNYLAFRHYATFDFSTSRYFTLSEKTLTLLLALDAPARIFMLCGEDSLGYTELKALLERYRDEASGRLRLEIVDRFTERTRADALVKEFQLADKEDVVVIRCRDSHRVVPLRDMVERDSGPPFGDRLGAFRGEDCITSAIAALVTGRRPTVYFLAGHGEADPASADPDGISDLKQRIERDNIRTATLNLLTESRIPQDADALVIAGPKSPLQPAETEQLAAFLSHRGNLLLLLDPGKPHGLDALLEQMNVSLPEDLVIWPARLAGLSVLVSSVPAESYGSHPIVERFRKFTLLFINARSIAIPDAPAKSAAQVTGLAFSPKSAWGETEQLAENTRFNEGRDHKGPLCLAAAIDTGRVGNENVDLAGSRAVVVGSASMFTNGGLEKSPLSADLARNALNWMLRQEQLIGIAPKEPRRYSYALSAAQLATLALLAGLVIPASVLLLGSAVWFQRRS